MGIARRRIGILAEDDGFHAFERGQPQAREDVVRRRENLRARRNPLVDAGRHVVGGAVREEGQTPPALRRRARAEFRESLRNGTRHRTAMRPSTFASTVPFRRT